MTPSPLKPNEKTRSSEQWRHVVRVVALAVVTQVLVAGFWYVSVAAELPPILDWLVAPGFLVILPSLECQGGKPPGVAEQERMEAIAFGLLLNIGCYAAVIEIAARFRRRRATR